MYPPRGILALLAKRRPLLNVLGEWVMVGGVLGVTLAILVGPAWILAHLPAPLPDDGLRHEPEPHVGAKVQTAYGPGVITAKVAYGDGPRWQVRLESGRHVVVYRAEMEVRR